MSFHLHLHDVEITSFVSYVVDLCSGAVLKTVKGGKKHLTLSGKHCTATKILKEASNELSRVQPSLDDNQKQQFSSALAVIHAHFVQVATATGYAKKRHATSLLLETVKEYEKFVMTTSALQIAKIAIDGRDAPAFRLYQKYSNADVDPIEVIQFMQKQLNGQLTPNAQQVPVEPQRLIDTPVDTPSDAPPAPEKLATALMDGLEDLTEVESCMDMDTSED